jgi:hypothetical protein
MTDEFTRLGLSVKTYLSCAVRLFLPRTGAAR